LLFIQSKKDHHPGTKYANFGSEKLSGVCPGIKYAKLCSKQWPRIKSTKVDKLSYINTPYSMPFPIGFCFRQYV